MGEDKALLGCGKESLVERVAGAVREAAGSVRLVGAPERYAHLDIPCLDERYAGCGPLSGIEAALREGGAEWSLVVACDMPGLEAGFLSDLCGRAAPPWDIVASEWAGRAEPLCAVYGRQALPAVTRALESGDFTVRNLLKTKRVLQIPAPHGRMVLNVNTPEEWTAWNR